MVAIGARGRKPVEGSRAGLTDMVIFPGDAGGVISTKRALYHQVFESLVTATEAYIINSGAKIEKLEISFATSAVEGASSGTAPWMFVSLAIDACSRVNQNRENGGKEPLSVTFKFVDAFGRTG